MMAVPIEEAPANFVPAAAVIRRGQALLGMTGRKGRVGGLQVGRETAGINLEAALNTVTRVRKR